MGDQSRNWQFISHGDRLAQPARMRGAIIIKAVVIIPVMFLVLLALVFAFYEGRKAYWDYRVSEMCKEDGGLVVFEKVEISHAQFLGWGGEDGVRGIPIPNESDGRVSVPYFRRTATEYIRSTSPTVRRSVTKFVRRADGKLLGKYIYYSRRGGDFPTWAHESSFGCTVPELIEENIFVIKEETK